MWRLINDLSVSRLFSYRKLLPLLDSLFKIKCYLKILLAVAQMLVGALQLPEGFPQIPVFRFCLVFRRLFSGGAPAVEYKSLLIKG